MQKESKIEVPIKKSNKTLVITLIIIVVFLIIASTLGYLGYNYFKQTAEPVANETDNETPVVTVPGEDSQDVNETPVVTNTTPPISAPNSPGGGSSDDNSGDNNDDDDDDCTDTCQSLGYECGIQTVCGQEVNCNSCSEGNYCDNGECIEIIGDIYYVASSGNDSNNGTSPETAWRTLSKVNAMQFQPGDNILLKRGDLWREQLIVPSSGNSTDYITFGAYGSGANPIIKGAYLASSWSDPTSGVYSRTINPTSPVDMVYEDDLPIKLATTSACSDGNWFYNTNTKVLYYKPITGLATDHNVSYLKRYWDFEGCVDLSNKVGITINGLDFVTCNIGVLSIDSTTASNHINVQNCSFKNDVYGIYFRTGSNGESTNGAIDNNYFYHCPTAIDLYTVAGHPEQIHRGWNITNNEIEDCGTYDGTNYWPGYSDHEAIGLMNFQDGFIGNNYIHDGDIFGIILFSRGITSGNLITRNFIYNNSLLGFVSAGEGDWAWNNNTVSYNVFWDCGSLAGFPYAIQINQGLLADKTNYIYNNIIHGGRDSMFVHEGNAQYLSIKNNIFSNYTRDSIYVNGAKTNLDIDYNLHDVDGMFFDGTGWKTLAEIREDDGWETHGMAKDPRFVNPTSGNFHIQDNSPAINAGADVGLTKDIEGNPIIGVPDIGAYEYQGITCSDTCNSLGYKCGIQTVCSNEEDCGTCSPGETCQSGQCEPITIIEADYYIDSQLSQDCSGTYSISNRDCSGSDGIAYNTIQKAADKMIAGDTCLIRGGTYNEQVEPINSGSEGDWIIYSGYPDEEAIIQAPLGNDYTSAMNFHYNRPLSYIRIENLELRGGDGDWGAGVRINGELAPKNYIILSNIRALNGCVGVSMSYTTNCSLEDSVIENNSRAGVSIGYKNEGVLIRNNSIKNNKGTTHVWQGTGIFVSGVNSGAGVDPGDNLNVLIEDNEIYNNFGWGMNLWLVDNAIIRENHISNSGYVGLQVEGRENPSRNIIVDGNLFEQNGQRIPYEGNLWIDDTDNSLVQNNTCRNSDIGIQLTAANQNIARFNKVYNNNQENLPHATLSRGIDVKGSNQRDGFDTYVVHNSLYNNARSEYEYLPYTTSSQVTLNCPTGSGLYDAEHVVVKNNIVSTIGTPNADSYDVFYRDNSHIIDYNCYFDENNRPLRFLYNTVDEDWQTWKTHLDINSLNSDPEYLDASNGNLELSLNSPCRDSGGFLTEVVSSGTSSQMVVEDAGYFFDGFGLIEGDVIQTNSGKIARVIDVDYNTNTLYLDRVISFNAGDKVSYVYYGDAPDIGAYEYQETCENCIYAASGNKEDIQSAINQASEGYTVVIPAGEWNISGTITSYDGINIKGIGKDNTILRKIDETSDPIFQIESREREGFEFSEMTLIGIGKRLFLEKRELNQASYVRDVGISTMGEFNDFKIHDCLFTGFATAGIKINPPWGVMTGANKGVIYENEFIDILYQNLDTGDANGYGVWVRGDVNDWNIYLGTDKSVFIEDNYFERCRHTVAAGDAARYVFRYNTVYNNYFPWAAIDAHGKYWSAHGTRSYEIYENNVSQGVEIDLTPHNTWGLGIRGGDGVIFNNIFEGRNRQIYLVIEHWEEMIETYDYPVPDQTTDLWIWENTLGGQPYDDVSLGYSTEAEEALVPYLQEGRDYHLQPKPGYTPYTYPHPLRNEQIVQQTSISSLSLFTRIWSWIKGLIS